MMNARRALVALGALVAITAGCGDDKGSNSSNTAGSTEAGTSTSFDVTTSSAGSSTSTSSGSSSTSTETTTTTSLGSSTSVEAMSLGDAIDETTGEKNATYTALASTDGDIEGLVSRLMAMVQSGGGTGGEVTTTTSATPTSVTTSESSTTESSTTSSESGTTTSGTANPLPFTGDLDIENDARMITIDDTSGITQVIVKDGKLYVQAPNDSQVSELDLSGANDNQTLADLDEEDLILLHDPVAVLNAVKDHADEATPSVDASTSGMVESATQWDVDVKASDIDDPFITELADRHGADEVTVHVWVDNETNYVTAVDLSIPGNNAVGTPTSTTVSSTTSESSTSTTGGSSTTDSTSTTAPSTTTGTSAQPLNVLVWFLSFGDAASVDAPEGDTTSITAADLATLVNVDLIVNGSDSTGSTTTTSMPTSTSETTTTELATTTSG